MKKRILKCTERGQITLPKQWRDKFNTDNYIIDVIDEQLTITPLQLEESKPEVEVEVPEPITEGADIDLSKFIDALSDYQN